jgi:hypothetical protein
MVRSNSSRLRIKVYAVRYEAVSAILPNENQAYENRKTHIRFGCRVQGKKRNVVDATIYALFTLSAVVSIAQFALNHSRAFNRCPIRGITLVCICRSATFCPVRKFQTSKNWTITSHTYMSVESAGMAYSPFSGHDIIFGGRNSEVPLDDTRELAS